MKMLLSLLFVCCLLYSCGLSKFNKKCVVDITKKSKQIKEKIMTQIDSVYFNDTLYCGELKRVLKVNCNDDNLIEVKVLTKCLDTTYFYFNDKIYLVETIYKLPDLH